MSASTTKASRLFVPPPLTPGALRLSALDHVKLYRQLFPYRTEPVQESAQRASAQGRSKTSPPLTSKPLLAPECPDQTLTVRGAAAGSEDGAQLRFRVVQDELARDLRQILGFTESLKRKLLDERKAKWLTHGLMYSAPPLISSRPLSTLVSACHSFVLPFTNPAFQSSSPSQVSF